MTPLPHLDTILSRLEGVRTEGDHWKALCPAHNDKNPSLGIAIGKEDRILLTCYAGCATTDVLAALDLSMNDLFPTKDEPVVPQSEIIQQTYPYQDASGTTIFRVVRYLPKSFKQQTPNKLGGWSFGLNGTEPVLYRLPELLEADPKTPVFKCAGEKDADRLVELGLIATTNPMGENATEKAWRPHYSDVLKGRDVVILADNDAQGMKHALFVAGRLHTIAKRIKIIQFTDLPEKGDVSDWLDLGHTRKELADLVKTTPVWEPQELLTVYAEQESPAIEVEKREVAPESVHHTDMGNADRLVVTYESIIRYCHKWGSWLVWNGAHWKADDNGEIYRIAKQTILSIYDEAKNLDDKDRKKLIAHALRSESAQRIRAMIDMAKDDRRILVDPEELDIDPYLFNVANGTVDLRTGNLLPHNPDNMMTRISAITYDLDADCPIWDSVLDRIMGRNANLIDFIQRSIGYSMTGDTDEQVMFILHGNGQNGKSVLVNVIRHVLASYAQSIPTERLMVRHGDASIPNDLASLTGVRFTASTETTEGKRLDESMVKTMTGGDPIRVRFLHKEYFDLIPQFKLWLATNHKPVIRGTDKGIWRRIRLIPFTVEIPEPERDLKLFQKLITESSGILNWMIMGCLNWQDRGLSAPQEVQDATLVYREEMDVFGTFLNDCCVFTPSDSVKSSLLYNRFKEWTTENGEYQLTSTAFGKKLIELGLERKTNYRGETGNSYLGIRLRGIMDGEAENTPPPLNFQNRKMA